MKRPGARGLVLMGALVVLAGPAAAQGPRQMVSEAKLREILEAARKKHDVPALGAAIVRSRGAVRVAVVGVRKRGGEDEAKVSDAFHLGSDTKAMTAWLIGQLVQEKKLRYNMTLAKAFPDLKTMHADFKKATLRQLMTHHAGLPATLPLGGLTIPGKLPIREQRQEVVKRALEAAPENEPGSKFVYSNLSYVLAGALIERVEDEAWEDVIRKRLFEPLKMKSAGFGAASAGGKDQPWPHHGDGTPAREDADNAPWLGPAGRVHCSLRDWSRFIADELAGFSGKGGLLEKETYKKLSTAPFADSPYTLGGWGSGQSKPGALVLAHGGSNKMNLATAQIRVAEDIAILVVTNQGGKAAEAACAEVRKELLALLKPKD